MLNTGESGDPKFPISKIEVGELQYEKERKTGILWPYRVFTVITTNGQLWDIRGMAFNTTKEVVANLWETRPDVFAQRLAKPVPPAKKSSRAKKIKLEK